MTDRRRAMELMLPPRLRCSLQALAVAKSPSHSFDPGGGVNEMVRRRVGLRLGS